MEKKNKKKLLNYYSVHTNSGRDSKRVLLPVTLTGSHVYINRLKEGKNKQTRNLGDVAYCTRPSTHVPHYPVTICSDSTVFDYTYTQ